MKAVILTAPRKMPTLDWCLESVKRAGFDPIEVLEDADRSISCVGQHQRALRQSDGEPFAIIEDDALVAANAVQYFEQSHGPGGIWKLYRSSGETLGREGWSVINSGGTSDGSLGYIWTRPAIETFHGDQTPLNTHVPELWIADFCGRHGIPMYIHNPSLIAHIGLTSVINEQLVVNGRRQASSWRPDASVDSKLDLMTNLPWDQADIDWLLRKAKGMA